MASGAGDPHGFEAAPEERVVLKNKHGESLVGVLHNSGSSKIVVLCHGFVACKDDDIFHDLAAALTKQGFGVFRFDFSGNGESEGEFQYGNYRKEADDLHSIVSYLQEKYDVTAIVGHSKGGNAAVTYASIYDDVHNFISISARFDSHGGIEGTKSMSKALRFLIIHGSADEYIPLEDAYEFGKLIPNHKLQIIMGANHYYTTHWKDVTGAIVDFMTSCEGGCIQLETTPSIMNDAPPPPSSGRPSSGVLSVPARVPSSSGCSYEGWTLKQLIEEKRRLQKLWTTFSPGLRHDDTQAGQRSPLPPHTASPASSLPGPICVLQQRTPPRHCRRTASSLSAPVDHTPPSDLLEHSHHLGKRLEEVLTSLRDVAFQLAKQGRQHEIPGILDVGLSIVASFCDAVRIPEAYKTVAMSENTKVPVQRLDPEFNLLYLQMKAAILMQLEGAVTHEILISLDDYAKCPLSLKNMVDISFPVRSVTCGHVYEQSDIMVYVGSCLKECPVKGCSGVVSADLVFEDAELRRDIRTSTHD